jgi:hypothetical protein
MFHNKNQKKPSPTIQVDMKAPLFEIYVDFVGVP